MINIFSYLLLNRYGSAKLLFLFNLFCTYPYYNMMYTIYIQYCNRNSINNGVKSFFFHIIYYYLFESKEDIRIVDDTITV